MLEFLAKYWLEVCFGLLASAFIWIAQRFISFQGGIQVLLRDRIRGEYNKYIEKGYCPIYALENVHALYKEYKALGGNGAMTALIKEMEKLPTQQPGGAGGSGQRRANQ